MNIRSSISLAILLLFYSFGFQASANNKDFRLIEERYKPWLSPGVLSEVSYESAEAAALVGCPDWQQHWEGLNRAFDNCDPNTLNPDPNRVGSYLVPYERGADSWSTTMVSQEFNVILSLECTHAPFLIESDIDGDSSPDVCQKPPMCESDNPIDGDPVNCATGQKVLNETVYSGSGPEALSYSLSYSSPSYNEESEEQNTFSSHLGLQRSDNHSKKLETIYTKGSGKIVKLSWGAGYSRIYATVNGFTKLTLPGATSDERERKGYILNSNLSYVDKRGDTTTFDASGNIISLTKRNGKSRTYSYTVTDKLESITNHYGNKLNFFYNGLDQLEKLESPNGEEFLFEYDSVGNLTKVIYPDDTQADQMDNEYIEYLFEDVRFPKSITGKINEKGIRFATWSYGDDGRAISSEHAGGLEKTEFDYSVENKTTVTTYANSNLSSEKTYHFEDDAQGRKKIARLEQLACTDCIVGEVQYEYNSVGSVLQKLSPSGRVTKYEYNSDNLETKRTEAFGTAEEKITTTNWINNYPLVSSVTQDNLQTIYGYTSTGDLYYKQVKDLDTQIYRMTIYYYYPHGKLKQIFNIRTGVTDKTYFYYDAEGNLSSIQNPLNQITTLSNYDANGRVGTITDPNGTITTLTYTPRGWLETSTTNGALTQYEYFPTGSIKRVTSPNGQSINYEYDDGERLVAIVDQLGNRIEYTRDLMGNVTENNTKDAAGVIKRTQTAVFNALGQIKQSLGSNGQSQTLTYDADGNPLTAKNAKDDTTSSNYDALNRLIKSIDPDAGETAYGYDSQDHLTSVTDAEGKTTSYEYNAFGEVTKLTSPDTGITTFTYDKAGNVLTKTDARNETTTYTYDALNRVLTQSYSDTAENIVYSYDDTVNGNKGIGRLTSVTDQSGTTSYFYNGFGQVTKETRVVDGKTYITEYHFDANGQMTGITYPGGRQVNYTFDSLNRISGMTTTHNSVTSTLASNVDYLPFGPMKSVSYGNGKALTQTFDLDYRLTDKTTSGIHQVSYGYDVTNNITNITDSLDNTKSQTFTYDKLSRLLSADGGYGSLDFTYDKIGNRLSKTDNGNVDTYAYASDAHRLLNITGSNANTFTHDAIGNTLTKDDLTFTYNKQGRLKSAYKTGMNAEYVYNFQGQRVSKQVDGVTTHFIYDLNGQLIAEADSTGAITKEYAYLNGQRLAVFENGATYFVHTDHLGTPIALSDSTGTVQWKAHYTPFGKAIVEVNNLTQNIRFPGQYFDSESGLHYNYFRDYDPEIGRYIQSDPIGLNGGINTYGYVGGNPVNWIDPLGLKIYPTYTMAGSGGIVFGAGEGGRILVLDFCSKKAYEYFYGGVGVGLGLGGAFTNEIGQLDIQDPSTLGGGGLNVSGFLAAGVSGVSGGINGSGPQDNVYVGINAGHAAGAGFGVSGTITYTYFNGVIDIPDGIADLFADNSENCECE